MSPEASAAPATPAPTPIPPAVRVEPPSVTVSTAAFPMPNTLVLQSKAIDEDRQATVRRGIERYLEALDRFRDSGATKLDELWAISGHFRDVVAAGMAASATPGVKRTFALGSFRIERFLVKTWGTNALAEVTATIFDRAVDGSAPDQVETGRLRLTGDRLTVVDGWDNANARWFNGPTPMTAATVREQIAAPIGFLLAQETWIPGSEIETALGASGETPYQRARHEYLVALDRTKTPSRTFADVTATVERYETFSEIRDGLATVRVAGTVITTDAAGQTQRAHFERGVLILFGNWIPEIVDEEIAPGRWLSGGDLALGVRDHTFA
jgi:hypothetical protein